MYSNANIHALRRHCSTDTWLKKKVIPCSSIKALSIQYDKREVRSDIKAFN